MAKRKRGETKSNNAKKAKAAAPVQAEAPKPLPAVVKSDKMVPVAMQV